VGKKYVWGWVDGEMVLFKDFGHDPKDVAEADKLRRFALEAQLSRKDASGERLSPDDISLPAPIIGRD
jgi:hypothetical protein